MIPTVRNPKMNSFSHSYELKRTMTILKAVYGICRSLLAVKNRMPTLQILFFFILESHKWMNSNFHRLECN